MHHRHEYDQAHGEPDLGQAAVGGNIVGLRPFTNQLRTVVWPKNFKLLELMMARPTSSSR